MALGPVNQTRAAGATAPAGDARTQTLERIGDLLSKLPEGKYYGTVGAGDVAPTAILQQLDKADYEVALYKDDGQSKPAGWVFKATRKTDGDQLIAVLGEHVTRKTSLDELKQFELALRTHMQANGLLAK